MKSKLICWVLMYFLFFNISAQEKQEKYIIKGIVTDASGMPIRNAIILIDGNMTPSKTNDKGHYRVKVPANAETIAALTFTEGTRGELISQRKIINLKYSTFVLNPLPTDPGEEVVNTGYATVKKKDLTTDITKIDGTKKNFASYRSIYEIIIRECSGVSIRNGQLNIQDSKNMQGSIPPVIIVDGIYHGDISDIPPSSVESISVLKGTSAAIYGVLGYGGAIIIKTKSPSSK